MNKKAIQSLTSLGLTITKFEFNETNGSETYSAFLLNL